MDARELDLDWAATLRYYATLLAVYITALVQNLQRIDKKWIPTEQLNDGSCDLWKKRVGGGGAVIVALLLAVKQENSPEGPHHKQKGFMKTTEIDGRVRTGDWILKVWNLMKN